MKRSLRIILPLLLIALFSGCGVATKSLPSLPELNFNSQQIDKTLPKVTEIKTLSEMSEVAFEWKPVYDDRINGYYIYRSDDSNTQTYRRVAAIDDKYSSHYVDENLEPNSNYKYKITTYSKGGISYAGKIVAVKTKPRIGSVSFIKALVGMPERIKLIWRPHPDKEVKSYIIERTDLHSPEWKKIATVSGRLNAEYIDTDVTENHIYKYRIKVKTFNKVTSAPSVEVKAVTKPLPGMVEGIMATTNLPRKIEIIWDKSKNTDIAYYKIYRSSNSKLLFSYHAKTKANNFTDIVDGDGTNMFYKVTAVDVDGLESIEQQKPVVGATLGKIQTPVITSAYIKNGVAFINWKNTDKRTVSNNIIKKYRDGWRIKKIKFTDFKKESFVDKNIKPDIKYSYTVIGVDQNKIESEPTEQIILSIQNK